MSSYKDDAMTSATKTIAIKPLNRIKQLYEKPEKTHNEKCEEENIHMRVTEAEIRLTELQQQQEEVLLHTREEVRMLKSDWNSERDQLITQTKEEGYAAGLALGKQEIEKMYAEKITEANKLVDRAEREHFKRIEQSNSSLIQLATQIAGKIMHTHIEENNDAFLSLVKGVIKELKEQPEINIYVPAEQYEFILLQKSELVELMNGKAKVSVYIASNQDCYISHPLGKIDISIDTQLSQMREKLLEIAMENQL